MMDWLKGILRGVTLEMIPLVHVEDVAVETSIHPDVLHPKVTRCQQQRPQRFNQMFCGLAVFLRTRRH